MGLFGKKSEGGFMDVIRCDLDEYLVWKWSPKGEPSERGNSIRYGSSLRVKDGEVAVFVYRQKSGMMQDFIVGPYDETIKTANFPILASIVGAAFGGSSPFQAEVYFLNLSDELKQTYFFSGFTLCDIRYRDFAVPASVKGSILFGISDYKAFIKKYRLRTFDVPDLWEKIRDQAEEVVKSVIINSSLTAGVELTNIQGALSGLSRVVQQNVKDEFEDLFKIDLKRLSMSSIKLDQTSDGYKRLLEATAGRASVINQAETDAAKQNLADLQAANMFNMTETQRIMREEAQRSQRLQTESSHLTAHQINIQGGVAMTAAESLGQMGSSMSFGDGGSGGGMNPAGMMAGMMMGGAVAGNMSNMMGNMMQGVNQPQPPQPPQQLLAQWHVSANGQQTGPFTIDQLRQMAQVSQLTPMSYMWKSGMGAWELAANIPELASIFGATPPPPPPSSTPPPFPGQ